MDSILQKIKRMIVFVEPGRIRPRVREIGWSFLWSLAE
jgi:hypothetical protein